jgi:thymidylate synthase (FAD)
VYRVYTLIKEYPVSDTIPVLDSGSVQLIDHMGDDTLISRIAGISHASDKGPGVESLISWEHFSPFEFGQVILRIKCPLFVARQLFRHRASSFMERSGRYVEANDLEFYMPEEFRFDGEDGSNKHQVNLLTTSLRHFYQRSVALYKAMRDMGIAKEMARIVFPMATYTDFYVRFDLRHLREFLVLRLSGHAQMEHRAYATAIYRLVSPLFPSSLKDLNNLYMESLDDCSLYNVPTGQENLQVLGGSVSDGKKRKEVPGP